VLFLLALGGAVVLLVVGSVSLLRARGRAAGGTAGMMLIAAVGILAFAIVLLGGFGGES
jgi:hypothetical protein